MNLVESMVDVSLRPLHEACATTLTDDRGTSPLIVCEHQPLHLRLTFSWSTAEDHNAAIARRLLAYVGHTQLQRLWSLLFTKIVVYPFLLPPDSNTMNQDLSSSPSSSSARTTFVFGMADFLSAPSAGWLWCGSRIEATASATTAGRTMGPDDDTPMSLSTDFDVQLVLPEVADLHAEHNGSGRLAFAIHLLDYSAERCEDVGTQQQQQPMDVEEQHEWLLASSLLRQMLATPYDESSQGAILIPPASVILGCCFCNMSVEMPLACHSVARALSEGQLLLSASLTNVGDAPLVVMGASLDLYSTTRVATFAEGDAPPTWSKSREGTRGDDQRCVDLLNRIVLVTPILVSDGHRPPIALQPGETYALQFILQLAPHLCFLLNPKSLEYLYSTTTSGSAAASVAVGGTSSASIDPLSLRDLHGSPVSAAELTNILSAHYRSHLYVHYNGRSSSATTDESGLHLRHPAVWSFVV